MGSGLKEQKQLLDTNILIDFLRGKKVAKKFLDQGDMHYIISTITVAELYAGVKGNEEKKLLKAFLKRFEIVPVTSLIAKNGGLIKNKYFRSHGVGIADAVIAATAIQKMLSLSHST